MGAENTARVYRKPAGKSGGSAGNAANPVENGKRSFISYLYSFAAHGIVLLLIIMFGGISKSSPPVDNLISIEILPGGGGGGGGGSSTMGENAGTVDQKLEPGVMQENQRPVDTEPVTATTQDPDQQRLPIDKKPRQDNTNATNATRTQDANSAGQTQAGNHGTTGTGGGDGNGNGTGTGDGTGSGTGGGNGSGDGTGTGSGTGPGTGSGSGGGKGNFPRGSFDMPLDCSKGDAGGTSGQAKIKTFTVTFKDGKIGVRPSNNTLRSKLQSVSAALEDKTKEYTATVECDCNTGECKQR